MLTCVVDKNKNRDVAIVDVFQMHLSRLLSRMSRTEHSFVSVAYVLIYWCSLHLMSMDLMLWLGRKTRSNCLSNV